ncbi:MAG: hypothetical protein SH868_15505 [Bythopirellula sp.]|nr:hypothetical protein [Bythopirellula sp.]
MANFLVAAFQTDLCERLNDLIILCGKSPAESIELFDDWLSVSTKLNEDGCIVCAYSGVWSVLFGDYELLALIFSDTALLKSLALRFETTAVSAYGDDTSCAYGFNLCSAHNTRSIFVQDSILENSGEPLAGEPSLDLETYNEEDILQILDSLGIDIEAGVESGTKFSTIKV